MDQVDHVAKLAYLEHLVGQEEQVNPDQLDQVVLLAKEVNQVYEVILGQEEKLDHLVLLE